LYINNYDEHTLTILFGGVLYEYVFNSSISEVVTLATKSISALVMWDEIFIPAENTLVGLLYFDGTSWILIEQATTDLSGQVLFNNLVMGEYMLCEAGDTIGVSFIIDQPTITYTTDMNIVPDKTIIDIDYLQSILGDNHPVDLSTISYEI